MNFKRLLTALVVTCICWNAGAQSKTAMKPIEFNDQMAAITDSLYQLGVEWGTAFSEIAKSDRNYVKLMPIRKKLTAYIGRTTEKLKKQPAVGQGSQELKSAVLTFLNFEDKMITVAFSGIEKLTPTSTQTEVDAAVKVVTDEAAKEEGMLKQVNTAQETYASKNGFTIENAADPAQ